MLSSTDPIKSLFCLKDGPLLISGPCSAETEEQMLTTACALKETGVKIFRAGIWKPRTNPDSFAGVGTIGLSWLDEVKRVTGMATATEVANPKHLEEVLRHNIDLIWIGARTTANPFNLQELAEAMRCNNVQIPILIKNPVNPDLEAWIGAIHRFRKVGMDKIGVVHRGFSTYGDTTFRNHPQWSIPLQLRTRMPEIPIISDPSHIAGRRELIYPVSQHAMSMGFDGLMIEAHCNPDMAWSDAKQQITPRQLAELLDKLVYRTTPVKEERLARLRAEIDCLDAILLETLSKRMKISGEIGAYKKENDVAVVQPMRFREILSSRLELAKEYGLEKKFVEKMFSAIHEESVNLQIT